ncbi:MAG TPA: hypothetical protein VFG36_06390, partial [Methanoregula sp.]|nr:hypothetical protein [Methanoregula sp.]
YDILISLFISSSGLSTSLRDGAQFEILSPDYVHQDRITIQRADKQSFSDFGSFNQRILFYQLFSNISQAPRMNYTAPGNTVTVFTYR